MEVLSENLCKTVARIGLLVVASLAHCHVSAGGEREDRLLQDIRVRWDRNQTMVPAFECFLEMTSTNRKTPQQGRENRRTTTQGHQSWKMKVACNSPKFRVTLLDSLQDAGILSDILFDGQDWRTNEKCGSLVVVRRADQFGGIPSINPLSLQSSQINVPFPLELISQRDISSAVSYVEELGGRLTLVFTTPRSSGLQHFIEFPNRSSPMPSRIWSNLEQKTISLKVYRYQAVSDGRAEICISRTHYSAPDAPIFLVAGAEPPDLALWANVDSTRLVDLEFVAPKDLEADLSTEGFHHDARTLDLRQEPLIRSPESNESGEHRHLLRNALTIRAVNTMLLFGFLVAMLMIRNTVIR